MENNDKTVVSEWLPLYLVDKLWSVAAKVVQPKKKEPTKDSFIKETKTILQESQKEKPKEEPKKIRQWDVTWFILPPKVEEMEDMLKIEDHLWNIYYTFFVNVFPDSWTLVSDLHDNLAWKGYLFQQFNLVFPLDQSSVLWDLKKKDRNYKQAIYERAKKDVDTLDLSIDYNELSRLRENIKTGNLRLMDVSIILQFFLKEEDLKKFIKNNIIQDLKALDLWVNSLRFLQKSFYENIHLDKFKREMYKNQTITSFQVDNDNFAMFNLFGRTGYEKSDGIYIGNDYESWNMVFRDIWGWSNFNFLSVGKSGWGKSYATKTLLTREYSLDTVIYIIDPENEFIELTKAIWGEIIDTTKDENKINPFDFTYIHSLDVNDFRTMSKEQLMERAEEMKQEFLYLIQWLENLIKLIVRKEGWSDKNNYIINHALLDYFSELGVDIEKPSSYFILKKNIGNMKWFYEKVVSMEATLSEPDRVVSNFTRKYAIGTGKELFASGKSNLSMKNKWTCFKFKDMADEIKDIMIFLVARFLVAAMMDPKVRHLKKRLAVDEAHVFFNDLEIAEYFLQILKRWRKYLFWLGLITQTIDDFFTEFKWDKGSKSIGNAIINNVWFTLLLWQKWWTIESLKKTLSLWDNEIEYIKRISGWKNAWVWLLITEDKTNRNITKIKIEAEDFLKKIIG